MTVSSALGDVVAGVPRSVRHLVPSAVRAELRDHWGWAHPGDLAYVPPVPAVPAGCRIGPPDVIVVGGDPAEARGLALEIARHPQVAVPENAEFVAHFFANGLVTETGPERNEKFCRWFPRRGGQVALHWSPDGLVHPWETELLCEVAPEARWVVVLRNPIDRLVLGLEATRDERRAHVGSYFQDAVERGFYGTHLARLVTHVGPERVKVLTAERRDLNPGPVLTEIDTLLALDPALRPVPPAPRARRRPAVAADATERIRELYARDQETLQALFPDVDLAPWAH